MGVLPMAGAVAILTLLGVSMFSPSSLSVVESIHLDVSGSISSSSSNNNPSPDPPSSSPSPAPDVSTSGEPEAPTTTTAAAAAATSTTRKPGKHLPPLPAPPAHIDPISVIDHLMHQLEASSLADGLLKMGQQMREKLSKFIDRFVVSHEKTGPSLGSPGGVSEHH